MSYFEIPRKTFVAGAAIECNTLVSLTADGICGCATWKKIAGATVGIGHTATVIDK